MFIKTHRTDVSLQVTKANRRIALDAGCTRSPEDIICMAQPANTKQERLFQSFSQFLHQRPEVLPQIAERMHRHLGKGNNAASPREGYEYLRMGKHFRLPNDLLSLVTLTLVYLYPEFNGKVKVVPKGLNEALGMRVSDRKLPGEYAHRVEWIDGQQLELSPMLRKHVQSVRPAQGELFEVAR